MSPEEQFKNYGCACRCLLAIAQQLPNPPSKEQFIQKFTHKFPFWEKSGKTGVTDTALILQIAQDLGIAKGFQIYRGKPKVREELKANHARAALLFTEKRPEPNAPDSEYYHCQLVGTQKIQDGGFWVIQVDENIQPLKPELVADEMIDRLLGYFLLLY